MTKLCVFDLDGTLADTAPTIAYFGNRALNAFGYPTLTVEQYKQMVGNGVFVLMERMAQAAAGNAAPELLDKLYKKYQEDYDNDSLYLTQPYEGISSMLVELKNMGIRLAVLSNKPHNNTCEVVNTLFPDGLIDRVQGQVNGSPTKPDPSTLLQILAQERVSPEECLYIGDSSVDMETGKNAGIFTIGVDWGFRGREELENTGADLIVSTPQEILDWVEAHQNHR